MSMGREWEGWDGQVLWEETFTVGNWGKGSCPSHIAAGSVGPLESQYSMDSGDQRIAERILVRIYGNSWEKPRGRVWRPLEAEEPLNSDGLGVEGMKREERGKGALLLHLGQDWVSWADIGSWNQGWKEIRNELHCQQWGSALGPPLA